MTNQVLSIKTKYTLLTLSIIILIVFVAFFLTRDITGVEAATDTQGTFGISISPTSSFLNAPNMAPGDWASAPVTVNNEGEVDFSYDVTAVKEGGSDLYYDTLDLKVLDQNGNLMYSGKLKDLQNLVLGVLGKGGNSTFNISVGLPLEVTNEFQALGSKVTFVFTATEHPPYIEGGEIVWDPPLEKPDVHVRRGNVMPIKFHLVSNGTFDTVKRGIDLYITGVNDSGEPVKYVFSVADGTLEWEEHGLNKPHYSLLLDTEKYPVKFDTYYTATAKLGSQVLGSTQFKSGK